MFYVVQIPDLYSIHLCHLAPFTINSEGAEEKNKNCQQHTSCCPLQYLLYTGMVVSSLTTGQDMLSFFRAAITRMFFSLLQS